MTKKQRMLTVGETVIPYEFERKRVKCLNLRVRRDGTVHLSVPLTTPEAFVERFLQERAAWIAEARARMQSRTPVQRKLQSGDVLLINGEPHTLQMRQGGRPHCDRYDGILLLTLRDPADEAEARRTLKRFVKREAAACLTARVEQIWPLFSPRPATFPTLSFRWMRSRWGSCTAAKNHITLNERLLFAPLHLVDYVIFHELCHFVHQNHSQAFYRHLSTFYPDYAAARRELAALQIPDLDER